MRRNTRVYSILKWVFIALTLLEALLLCVTADMTHGAAAVLFALCAFAFGVQGRRRPSTGEEPDEPPKKGKKSKKSRLWLALLAVPVCAAVLFLVLSGKSGGWLMSEREILAYYRETYGQEMTILSRSASEYQEGDTHTRSQDLVLCPVDQPDLEFHFSQWAGYAYSPGPIPQLWPSFSEGFRDLYPSDALAYALRQFVTEQELGVWEQDVENDRVLTLAGEDWEGAVRQIADYVNGLSGLSPYDRLETIWLLCFRLEGPGGESVTYRADLIEENRLRLDAGEIIAGLKAAGARDRAALAFAAGFQEAFPEARAELSYRDWTFCHEFEAFLDVGSMEEVDRVLERMQDFVSAHQGDEIYTALGLEGLRVTAHFVLRGTPEPRGQIGTWAPFAGTDRMSIDTAVIRERIRKLYLLPETAAEAEAAEPETEPLRKAPETQV